MDTTRTHTKQNTNHKTNYMLALVTKKQVQNAQKPNIKPKPAGSSTPVRTANTGAYDYIHNH